MAIYDFLSTTNFESLKNLMLESVPEDLDTAQGSFLYDAITPISLFTSMIFDMMKVIIDESNLATASMTNLEMIGATRPRVYRYAATHEQICIAITPVVGESPIVGSDVVFTDEDGVAYTVTDVTGLTITADANDYGPIGSTIGVELEPSTTIQGAEKFTISKLVKTGQNRETDEEFRFRIWRSFSTPFTGTVADYYKKMFSDFSESENGFVIKYALVIPRGGYSGAITIIASKDLPSLDMTNRPNLSITEMQNLENYFDEKVLDTTTGEMIGGYGLSLSPIGHVVNVRDFIKTDYSFKFRIKPKSLPFEITNEIKNLIHEASYAYFDTIVTDSWPSAEKYNDAIVRNGIYKISYEVNMHEREVINVLEYNGFEVKGLEIFSLGDTAQTNFEVTSLGTVARMPVYKLDASTFEVI